jgi:D-3-phosphoglycerate dehydrogenase
MGRRARGHGLINMSKPRIVVTERYSPAAMERLAGVGEVTLLDRRDEATLIAAVADADALVVRTHTDVTRRVIEAARCLRVIARGGVGLDNIDLAAARERGIPVVYTPAASTHAVADFAIGLIIGLQRRIAKFDQEIRGGDFALLRSRDPGCAELRHQTLGIIGMGRIGSQVARRASLGFGMEVLYNDIRPVGPFPFAATSASRDQVLAAADVISMHVPLTALTRGMIDRDAISRMKCSACLINTSRGPVVVAADLAKALREGRIAGAAVDVFDPEPPPADHPLRSAPNCVLTPHVASRSREGLAAMNDVVDDVVAVLQGRAPIWPWVDEPG